MKRALGIRVNKKDLPHFDTSFEKFVVWPFSTMKMACWMVISASSFSHGFLRNGPTTVRRLLSLSRASVSSKKEHRRESSKKERRTHPRNAFQGSYNMERLCQVYPKLSEFIITSPYHNSENRKQKTIPFDNPQAVRALNTAVLFLDYNLTSWELPEECLTPPVPGRADYIHTIADVLAESSGAGVVPTGSRICGLDVGTGASLIYPIIGSSAYGWSFCGTDVQHDSLNAAQKTIDANSLETVDLRLQKNRSQILQGVWKHADTFDFVMCNPPFYKSREAFELQSARKTRNLAVNKRKRGSKIAPTSKQVMSTTPSAGSSNFMGNSHELWCPGGEVAFCSTMIAESRSLAKQCLWFSCLVSRRDNAERLHANLLAKRSGNVRDTKLLPIGQGNKSAMLLFWSFMDKREQAQWGSERWKG